MDFLSMFRPGRPNKPGKMSSGYISLKAALALVLFFLFTVFVFQNTEVTDVTFLFWKLSLSRVLLLLGSLAVGCVIGVLVGWMLFGGKPKPKKETNY